MLILKWIFKGRHGHCVRELTKIGKSDFECAEYAPALLVHAISGSDLATENDKNNVSKLIIILTLTLTFSVFINEQGTMISSAPLSNLSKYQFIFDASAVPAHSNVVRKRAPPRDKLGGGASFCMQWILWQSRSTLSVVKDRMRSALYQFSLRGLSTRPLRNRNEITKIAKLIAAFRRKLLKRDIVDTDKLESYFISWKKA